MLVVERFSEPRSPCVHGNSDLHSWASATWEAGIRWVELGPPRLPVQQESERTGYQGSLEARISETVCNSLLYLVPVLVRARFLCVVWARLLVRRTHTEEGVGRTYADHTLPRPRARKIRKIGWCATFANHHYPQNIVHGAHCADLSRKGLSTLAEAVAAARNLALGMPSTSSGISRTVTLNPPSDSENPHPNAQRRYELEDRVDEEEEEEGEEEEQVDESLLKALRRMGIRAPKQFDPKSDKNF